MNIVRLCVCCETKWKPAYLIALCVFFFIWILWMIRWMEMENVRLSIPLASDFSFFFVYYFFFVFFFWEMHCIQANGLRSFSLAIIHNSHSSLSIYLKRLFGVYIVTMSAAWWRLFYNILLVNLCWVCGVLLKQLWHFSCIVIMSVVLHNRGGKDPYLNWYGEICPIHIARNDSTC